MSAGSVTDFAHPGTPQTNISGLTWFNHGSQVVLIQNGSLISVRVDGSQPRNPDGSYAPTAVLSGETGITQITANAAGTLLAFTENTSATTTSLKLYDTTKPAGRRTAKSVTLSRSDLFADALGGAGFAAHQQGPLLLTDPKTL